MSHDHEKHLKRKASLFDAHVSCFFLTTILQNTSDLWRQWPLCEIRSNMGFEKWPCSIQGQGTQSHWLHSERRTSGITSRPIYTRVSRKSEGLGILHTQRRPKVCKFLPWQTRPSSDRLQPQEGTKQKPSCVSRSIETIAGRICCRQI